MRKDKDVISKGTIEFFEKENEDVLAYRRTCGEEELIVLNNLTGKEITVPAEAAWTEYRKLVGNYEGVQSGGGCITLRPFETVALEK